MRFLSFSKTFLLSINKIASVFKKNRYAEKGFSCNKTFKLKHVNLHSFIMTSSHDAISRLFYHSEMVRTHMMAGSNNLITSDLVSFFVVVEISNISMYNRYVIIIF